MKIKYGYQVIVLLINLLGVAWLAGCSSKPTYYEQSQIADNLVCPYTVMNFDRKLAAERRLQIAMHKINYGMMSVGKQNLDCALKYSPQMPLVHRVYAFYFEHVGENEYAEEAYKHALSLAPRDPETHNQYGAFLCKMKRYDDSIEHFMKAIDVPAYSQVSATYENAGICSRAGGNMDKAEKYFRKVLSYDPKAPKTLLEMAEIQFNKAHHQQAQNYINRYSKLASHTSRSLWLAMRIEKELGNRNALGSYALKLEQMFPDSEETALYQEVKKQWQN